MVGGYRRLSPLVLGCLQCDWPHLLTAYLSTLPHSSIFISSMSSMFAFPLSAVFTLPSQLSCFLNLEPQPQSSVWPIRLPMRLSTARLRWTGLLIVFSRVVMSLPCLMRSSQMRARSDDILDDILDDEYYLLVGTSLITFTASRRRENFRDSIEVSSSCFHPILDSSLDLHVLRCPR